MSGPGIGRRRLLSGLPVVVAAAAGANASAGREAGIVGSNGVLRIDRDTTMAGDIQVASGGRISLAEGTTLTVLGDVTAPASRLFEGEGRVDLTRSRLVAARPEWWGAIPGDSAIDCRAALSACLLAHPAMQLGPGDYHLGGTWTIAAPGRRIWGIGRGKDTHGTRLLAHGGEGVAVRVGSEIAPTAINDYLSGIDLRWIEIGRIGQPAPRSVGLAVDHVLDCRFEGIRASEHESGFAFRGVVASQIEDCRAFRSAWGGLSKAFVGFDCDGHAPAIATGANASLTMLDCKAWVGNPPPGLAGIGARISAAMSDTWIVRLETAQLSTGVKIDGAGSGTGAAYDQIDVRIEAPVLDGADVGIDVRNLGPRAMVEIVSPYVGLRAGGRVGIAIADTGGSVRVSGGQLVGGLAEGATGMLIERADGVTVDGAALNGFARPVTAVGASGGSIAVSAYGTDRPADVAVALSGCRRMSLRPRVTAGKGRYAAGVAVDAESRAISIETIMIDPDALARPDAGVTVARRVVRPAAGSSVVFVE